MLPRLSSAQISKPLNLLVIFVIVMGNIALLREEKTATVEVAEPARH
jgi:galactitol-specific phosphotransferase system IIC component